MRKLYTLLFHFIFAFCMHALIGILCIHEMKIVLERLNKYALQVSEEFFSMLFEKLTMSWPEWMKKIVSRKAKVEKGEYFY